MSAGLCGKRLGLEDSFGSPSPSAKRARCSHSPIRSPDCGLGSDGKVLALLQLFPSMSQEIVEEVLNAHDCNIDEAIKSLRLLCLRDISGGNDLLEFSSMNTPNGAAYDGGENGQMHEQMIGNSSHVNSGPECRMPVDIPSWAEIFVQEMSKVSNLDDVRECAKRILEAFEKVTITNCRATDEQDIATLKEQLHNLLKENHLLKRAVQIQHERSLEHEEKLKDVQQLKLMITQYQEQVRTLEINNYTLKIHLQRAQEASSMPSHFHPDIF